VELRDKVVLLTGASEGIGAACAAAFRAAGARLSLTARSREKLAAVAAGEEVTTPADLQVAEDRRRVVDETLCRFGRIDVLVNNAGVGLYAPAHAASIDDTRRMFELNFFAPLELIQLVTPGMKARGTGAIVNVSSIGGKVTLPWFTLYSATKFALGALTEGLRMELRRDGIHCMTVCPGYVKTRFQQNILSGDVPPALGGLRNRWAITPERCAEAIVSGLRRDANTVVTPATGWFFIGLERIAPSLVHRRMENIYHEQRVNR
jgi:short-subunit dehydrogenase